jgi:DNA-binding CsgD family transcriptional regulator
MLTLPDGSDNRPVAAVPTALYGRAAEQSVIDRLIAEARDGRSGALVVRGEVGIGKTALLDYAASAAAGAASAVEGGAGRLRVIRGAGVEPEAELPFAGLHLLLGGVLDRLSLLPGPQQNALGAAFGLRPAVQGDRFLLGLAVLSLLAELAEDGPVLCLIDDAHWLDRASADALVFAARRLQAEGIAVVFAARDDDMAFRAAGLPEVRLRGLDLASATELLHARTGADLPPGARYRLLTEAAGNPLALIELPKAYGESSQVLSSAPGVAIPLTERLQQAFAGQVRRLPDLTQELLVVAAAEGSGDLRVVLEAAAAFGVTVADLEPAERAGLLRGSEGVLTFRHPLIRAVVYQGAGLNRRLGAHRALAEALRGPVDADRRAWHLAVAASGPDEAVAAELERTATDAGSRSGYAAAVAAYERAVQLTVDPAARARRLTLAAEAAVQIGEFDRARGLATSAAGHAADPVHRARLTSVLALSDFGQGRLQAAHRLLVDGAQIRRVDTARAAKFLMNAVHVAWFLGDRALMTEAAEQLNGLGWPVVEPFAPLVALMLRSTAQAVEQPDEESPSLAELVANARRSRMGDRDDLAMIAMASLVTGRNLEAVDLTSELVADARAHGRIGWLPAMVNCLTQALLFDGRHRDALATVTEALRIAYDTGQPQWTSEANAISAYLAAVAGDEQRCHLLADTAIAEPASHFTSAAKPWARWALGVLDLGQGRLDSALTHLEMATRDRTYHYGSALHSVPDLVEAAVRLGQPERADQPLAALLAWAGRAESPNTDALAHRCQALLSGDQSAEQHYLAALELHEPSFEQARTQLLYGVWLRRLRRKADARIQLRAAVAYLDRTDASPWARQARTELAATGASTPRQPRGEAGRPVLTPQELQVTRLAAQGLSNRDIAAQLFLSPRTVAYHLYKAFPKLDVASRAELDPDALDP